MNKIKLIAGALLITTMGLTGCATPQTADMYTGGQAMINMTVDTGTIVSLDNVKIQHHSSGVGAEAGASLGGLAGFIGLGRGTGHIAGALIGAAVGGVAGAIADKAANKDDGIQIVYKDDQDGKMHAVVQQVDPKVTFTVGERIKILTAGGIQSRVEPL